MQQGTDTIDSGADVLITTSMIYYLDLRFRIKDASRVGPGTNRYADSVTRRPLDITYYTQPLPRNYL
jgi:hypothetical protein